MSSIAQLIIPADGLGSPDGMFADWRHKRIYLTNWSNASIRGYNEALVTQTPFASVVLDTTGGHISGIGDVDEITGALIIQVGSGVGMPVCRFDPLTFTKTGSYGASTSSPSYPNAIQIGENIVCVSCGTLASGGALQASYALIKETLFSGNVAVIRTDTTPMQHAGAYLNVVSGDINNRGFLIRGASGRTGASAFSSWANTSAGQTQYPLYRIDILPGAETYNPSSWPATNPYISSRTVGWIQATDIDPTWASLTINAMGYDASDGNVLISVFGPAGQSQTHLAKINAATAAVMWSTPSSAFIGISGPAVAHVPAIGSGNLADFTTSSGAVALTPYPGVSPNVVGAFAGDPANQLMVLSATYTQGSGSPTPVAGTASSFNGWAVADWILDINFPLPPEVKEVLLPSAELQFSDANGHPYAGGTLELLVPGTTTFKDTWTDPDGLALNTNPIVLDAAGRCIVYGDGAYRSILKDALGNLIWDRETTTEVSAAMMPVVGAPTIAEAQRLLGIDDSGLPAETAAREAADAAETAARIAADANLQSEIDAETAARIAADAALAAIGGPNVRAGQITTNSSGFAHITFATPFPTACQGITVTPAGQHAPTPLTATTNTPDAAGCDVYTGVYGSTSVAPAATSVYYIAVGN